MKILDFGLARQVETEGELTGSGAMLGTPSYMSPEQANGDPVDGRTDLFSLGVLLYRLTTGKLPFAGATLMATVAALATKDPTPVLTLRPDCPPGLADLIHRLLAKDRDQRPATARAVADELLKLDRDGSQTQIMAPIVEALPVADPWASIDDESPESSRTAAATVQPPPVAKSPDTSAPSRRKPWLIALPLLLLLAGGGFIIIKVTNKDGSVTELKVPDDAKIEVNGKTVIAEAPKKVEPKNIAPKDFEEDKIDFAAERKAAEWVVSRGGRLQVITDKGATRYFDQGKKSVLPDEPFLIQTVNLANEFLGTADPIDVADLVNLEKCSRIRELILYGQRRITAQGLSHLRASKDLRSLNLSFCSLGNDFGAVLRNWVRLEHLNLESVTTLSDRSFAEMPDLPFLRGLHLVRSSIDDVGLSHLANHCPRVASIAILDVPQVTAKPVASLKSLRSLYCRGRQFRESDAIELAKSPRFSSLTLHLSDPSDAKDAISKLLPLKNNLTHLYIGAGYGASTPTPGVSEAEFLDLGKFTALQTLELDTRMGGLTENVYAQLSTLPELKTLKLLHHKADTTALSKEAAAFRRRRPDVAIGLGRPWGHPGINFPALTAWPEGPDGLVAPWSLPKDAPPPAIVPFSADEAKKHQEAWAAYLKRPVIEENKLGMKFALIPPGEFVTTEENQPQSLVRVEKAFDLATTEVTVAQFRAFVEATGYVTEVEKTGKGLVPWTWQENPAMTWKTPGYETSPMMPVTQVTPADARAFCRWLSEKDGQNYRLPTVVEWELAARAGGEGNFGWCDPKDIADHAWYRDHILDETKPVRPVAGKKANPFGLYDVLGSVWELCSTSADVSTGFNRVSNGWGEKLVNVKGIAVRRSDFFGVADTGFRVLRQIDKTPEPKPFTTPVLIKRGQPLNPRATVSQPAKIAGVRCWSVEPVGRRPGEYSDQAWSADGKWFAMSDGSSGADRVWIVDDKGGLVAMLPHPTETRGVSFSADGRFLAVSGLGYVRLWECGTWKRVADIPVPLGWNNYPRFSPKESELAVPNGMGLFVFRMADGRRTELSRKDFNHRSAIWSPDGQSILLDLTVFSKDGSRAEIRLEPAPPQPAYGDWDNWSRDGKWIVAKRGMEKMIWDAKTGKLQKDVPTPLELFEYPNRKTPEKINPRGQWDSGGITLRSDGSKVVCFPPDQAMCELDPILGTLLRPVDPKREGAVGRGAWQRWSPNGKYLTSTSGFHDWPVEVRHSDGSNRRSTEQRSHQGRVAWAPDSERFATLGKTIVVWDAKTAKKVAELAPPKPLDQPLNDLGWSADGKMIAATYSQEETVFIWNAADEKFPLVHRYKVPGMTGWEGARLAWDPNSQAVWVSLVLGKAARLDVRTGRTQPSPSQLLTNTETQISFDPSGDRFFSRHRDGWTSLRSEDGDVRDFGKLSEGWWAPLPTWMPDGRRFLAYDGGRGVGFDTKSGRRLGALYPWLGDGKIHYWLCVGPDGHYRGGPVDRPSDGTDPKVLATLEEHIAIIAQLDDGSHVTLTPAEFQKRFGWKNDPAKARLMKLDP